MIAATLAKRDPVVICDGHQDFSGDQHALGMAMLNQGARLRVFADPVRRIFKESPLAGSTPAQDWVALTKQAHAFEVSIGTQKGPPIGVQKGPPFWGAFAGGGGWALVVQRSGWSCG